MDYLPPEVFLTSTIKPMMLKHLCQMAPHAVLLSQMLWVVCVCVCVCVCWGPVSSGLAPIRL